MDKNMLRNLIWLIPLGLLFWALIVYVALKLYW